MKIIELNETQFKSYSLIHSKRNIYQTVEYATMQEKKGYEKLFVGLIDNNNNLVAAALILSTILKGKYKFGHSPRGFLIDFNNAELLTVFTNELKKFLKKRNFVFLKVDPLVVYKEYDKNGNLIKSQTGFMQTLKSLGYAHLGFNDYFESNNSRFHVILNTGNLIEETYKNLSRNIKRSLKESQNMGISIHKGSLENIDLFYSLVRKKVSNSLEEFKDYFRYYSTENIKFELYFAKINPEICINNFRYLERLEQDNNRKIYDEIAKNSNKRLIAKKIFSDNLLQRYKSEIVKATNIYSKFPNGLVIGTCAILRNDNEIIFIVDGYEEKLREIHSSYMLKWEVIKKYMTEGYQIFDLGEISGNINKENNKYYGLYFSKIGFNGRIIEYPGEFDLIINNTMYGLFYNVMNLKSKVKK